MRVVNPCDYTERRSHHGFTAAIDARVQFTAASRDSSKLPTT
jgi:hypothetical protein